MAKKIVISIVLILILLLCNADNSHSFSARNEIYLYGSGVYGSDVSGVHYNPAMLVNLSMALSEFVLTTDKEFVYNSFYSGFYLTRFPLLSKSFWTSLNLGLGMEKIDNNKNYLVSFGGTLIKSLKYGFSYKYTAFMQEKYSDFDTGILIELSDRLVFGFSIKNFADKEYNPVNYIPGLYIKIIDEIKFTVGMLLIENMNDIDDYSAALEINLFRNFYTSASYQKDFINIGIGNNFNYNSENIHATFKYDRNAKKINRFILSYNHKFHNIFYSGKKVQKKGGPGTKAGEKDTIGTKKEIEKEQKYYLNKAKRYYAEGRFDVAKEMISEILALDKNSKYAQEAKRLRQKIRKMEK